MVIFHMMEKRTPVRGESEFENSTLSVVSPTQSTDPPTPPTHPRIFFILHSQLEDRIYGHCHKNGTCVVTENTVC